MCAPFSPTRTPASTPDFQWRRNRERGAFRRALPRLDGENLLGAALIGYLCNRHPLMSTNLLRLIRIPNQGLRTKPEPRARIACKRNCGQHRARRSREPVPLDTSQLQPPVWFGQSPTVVQCSAISRIEGAQSFRAIHDEGYESTYSAVLPPMRIARSRARSATQ